MSGERFSPAALAAELRSGIRQPASSEASGPGHPADAAAPDTFAKAAEDMRSFLAITDSRVSFSISFMR